MGGQYYQMRDNGRVCICAKEFPTASTLDCLVILAPLNPCTKRGDPNHISATFEHDKEMWQCGLMVHTPYYGTCGAVSH